MIEQLCYFDPKNLQPNNPSKYSFNKTYKHIYEHTFKMLTKSVYFNNVAKVMYKKFFVNNLEPVAKNFYDKIGPNIINYFSEHVFEDIFAVAFNEYLMDSKYLSKRIRVLVDIIIAQNKNHKYFIYGGVCTNGIVYGCRYSDLYKEMLNVDLFFCKHGENWEPVTDKTGMYDLCELYYASGEKSETHIVNLKHELEKLAKHCIIKFLEYMFVQFYIRDVAKKNRKYLREIYVDIESFRVRNASTLIEHTQKIINNIENAICLSLDLHDETFPTKNLNIDILVYFITALNDDINMSIVNDILNGESYYKKLAKISDMSTSWIAKNGAIYETAKSNILAMSVYSTNKLANTFIDPEVAQDLTSKVISSILPIVMTSMCGLYQLYDLEGEEHLNNQIFARNIISFVLQSLKQEIVESYNKEKLIEYFNLNIDAFKNQQRIKIEKMIETTYPDEPVDRLNDIKKKTMDHVNKLIDLICTYIMNHNMWCKELLNRWVNITSEKAIEYLDLKQIYRDLFSDIETAKNNYSMYYTHYSHYLNEIVDEYVLI